ncbi:hypothetical protein ABIA43_004910 [Bradyrhizobium sp. USDA 328]
MSTGPAGLARVGLRAPRVAAAVGIIVFPFWVLLVSISIWLQRESGEERS